MQLVIQKSFYKDFEKIKDGRLSARLDELLEVIHQAIDELSDKDEVPNIPNMIKLSGFSNAYRIRLGTYRIGVLIKEEKYEIEIEACITSTIFSLERFVHRKDFYRKFPKS